MGGFFFQREISRMKSQLGNLRPHPFRMMTAEMSRYGTPGGAGSACAVSFAGNTFFF